VRQDERISANLAPLRQGLRQCISRAIFEGVARGRVWARKVDSTGGIDNATRGHHVRCVSG
jgi:hypothetical protein